MLGIKAPRYDTSQDKDLNDNLTPVLFAVIQHTKTMNEKYLSDTKVTIVRNNISGWWSYKTDARHSNAQGPSM